MPSFILLELTDGAYKVKETDFVEETQIISQIDGNKSHPSCK